MIPDRILIWTPKGYKQIGDLAVGDRIISYNELRGCTEYDEVLAIETEYVRMGLIGIKQIGLHYISTPDHPVLLIDKKTRELESIPIEDLFMRKTAKNKAIVSNKMFEPYQRSQDLDYLEWTARLAASSSREKMPVIENAVIWDSIKEITGPEAQHWLNTFFHWNILKPRNNYMKTILMRNSFVRDMLYHVAPRAGVGTYWGLMRTHPRVKNFVMAYSITKEKENIIYSANQWCADRQEGIVYNITSRNGSFLARYLGGVFLLACYKNKGEK